jgi:hypothetical protein
MYELNEAWVQDLTNAIGGWFDDKVVDWNDILSEGLLIVPVAEFLLKREWKLSGERSKAQIFKDARNEAYVSYDVCAEKEEGKCVLLIELKFIKPRKCKNGLLNPSGAALNKKRIQKDVSDLIGVGQRCERLLIIAIHPNVTSGIECIEKLVKEVAPSAVRFCKKNDGLMSSRSSSVKVLSFYLEPASPASMKTLPLDAPPAPPHGLPGRPRQ